MLSESFAEWVNRMVALHEASKVQAAQPLRRNETVREFFASRSSK